MEGSPTGEAEEIVICPSGVLGVGVGGETMVDGECADAVNVPDEVRDKEPADAVDIPDELRDKEPVEAADAPDEVRDKECIEDNSTLIPS